MIMITDSSIVTRTSLFWIDRAGGKERDTDRGGRLVKSRHNSQKQYRTEIRTQGPAHALNL